MNNEEFICKEVAELFARRDWHRLSCGERKIVGDLVQAGYLEEQDDGFVGKEAERKT
jgi:hypothetical protein